MEDSKYSTLQHTTQSHNTHTMGAAGSIEMEKATATVDEPVDKAKGAELAGDKWNEEMFDAFARFVLTVVSPWFTQ